MNDLEWLDPVVPHKIGYLPPQTNNGKSAIIVNLYLLDAVRNTVGKWAFLRNRYCNFALGGHESFQIIKQHRFSTRNVSCFEMNQQKPHRVTMLQPAV